MKAGIDYGFFMVKNSKRFKYNSGSLESKSNPVGAAHRVRFQDRYYSIGENRSFISDKTADDNMLVQMLPAMGNVVNACNMEKGESRFKDIPFEMGVGTPLKYYGEEKEEFHDYFSGKILDFEWNGTAYSLKINRVDVWPQGYAAYLANYDLYGKYQDMNVIDIGGGTLDIFQIHGGMPIVSTFKSLKLGVISLTNQIYDELESADIRISESQICDAVMGKDILHLQEKLIQETARTGAHDYINMILPKIRERQFDLSIPCLLIGGGGLLLQNYWEEYPINIVGFLDEYANAEAYEKLLGRN